MKLELGYGSQIFRLSQEGFFCWFHTDAKNIKKGLVYRHMLSHKWTSSVDDREIYTIEEKDRHTSTHWLVKHKVLNQFSKLEFRPVQQVFLLKEVDDKYGYWTIKQPEQRTIFSPKAIDEFYKKIEENKKKKK